MRNISMHTQNMIALGVDPDVYNNTIVYCYSVNDTPQIYMYDIATKKAIDVSGDGYNSEPHAYSNKIIWSDINTRLDNIRMYDIDTKQQQYFTNWLNSQQDFISLFHFYRNWVLNFDFLFHNVSSRLELTG